MKKHLSPLVASMLWLLLGTAWLPAHSDTAERQRYNSGIALLESGQTREAAHHFETWLDESPKAPLAMLGMGRILTADNPASRRGRKLIRNAAKNKAVAGEAFYHLGCAHFNEGQEGYIEAILYFNKAKKADSKLIDTFYKLLAIRDYQTFASREAVEALSEGILANPNHPGLYQTFVETACFNSQVQEGLATLEKLRQLKDDTITVDLDRVQLHLLEDGRDEARILLKRLQPQGDHPLYGSRYYYLLACLEILEDNPAGEQHYRESIKRTQTRQQLEPFIHDLRYVMTDAEWAAFHDGCQSPSDLITQFWEKRLPNPFESRNSRLTHYYKTLYYGRRHYRRYTNAGPHPEGFGRNDLDDMATILLRHGEPDAENSVRAENLFHGRTSTTSKMLTYYSRNNRSQWKLHLNYSNYKGQGWVFESAPAAVTDMENIGVADLSREEYLMWDLYDETLGDEQDMWRDISLGVLAGDPSSKALMRGRNRMSKSKTEVRLQRFMDYVKSTETAEEVVNKALNIPVVARFFRSDAPGSWEVAFYHMVTGSEVDLQQSGSILPFSYAYTARDSTGNVRFRETAVKTLPVHTGPEGWKKTSVMLCEQVKIPMDVEALELHILNRGDSRMARFDINCQGRSLDGPGLCHSDAILSGTITEQSTESQFCRKGWAITPHMFHAFRKDETVGVYSEIYNLTLNENGRTHYEVTWTVATPDGEQLKEIGGMVNQIKSVFARKQNRVGSSSQHQGSSRDEALIINLDLGQCRDSLLILKIAVKDLISGEETAMHLPVSIEQ